MKLSKHRPFCCNTSELPPTSELRNKPGVYIIIGGNNEGKPLTLDRVARRDPKGVLYIGETATLRDRLLTFRNMVCPQGGQASGHAGAVSYRESQPIKNLCPAGLLLFRYSVCSDKAKARAAERKLLRDYLNTYGELPPLNFSR